MARLMLLATLAIVLISTAVHGQWQPNVPVENRTLDEIYEAAQAEKCSQLRVAAGGDGTRDDLQVYAQALIELLQPKATGPALLKAFKKDSL